MKRKNSVLKLLFLMTLTLFSALVIVACTPTNTDKADVASAKSALEIGYTAPDTKDSVKNNLTLPTTGDKNVTITWQSSDPSVVSTAGVVTRPATDISVTLTATLTKGNVSDPKSFIVNVVATETIPATAEEAMAALTITGSTLVLEGNFYSTTTNVVLPTTSLGFTINWVSTSTAITTAGVVTRPAYGEGDERVVLTASIGDVEKDFIIDVTAIQDKPAEDILASAQTSLLLTSAATAENLTLPTQIIVQGETEDETYTVTVSWTSDSTHMNSSGQVDRPVAGQEDALVNLTATLSYGGITSEKEFSVVVFAYVEAFTVVANFDAAKALYIAADEATKTAGVYVRVQDVSLVLRELDGLVLVDSEGTLMYTFGSQGLSYKEAEFNVLYDVIGALDFFNGALQISATKNDRKPTELLVQEGDAVVPNYETVGSIIDFLPATQQTHTIDNIFEYKALTLTAKVVVNSTTDNYGVLLSDVTYTGDGSDLRAAGGTAYENRAFVVYYKSNKEAFLALDGLEVTVNVVLFSLRNDRNIYTVLFGGTIDDILVEDIADADLMNMTKSAIGNGVPKIVPAATTLNLIDNFLSAGVSWTSSHPSIISLDGLVTPPAEGQIEVTLTASITAGALTEDLVIKVLVGQLPLSSLEQALAAAANTPLRVEVTIVGYSANNTVIVHDGKHAIAVFIGGAVTTTETASLIKNSFGKRVILEGSKTSFNGLEQIQHITNVEVLTNAVHTALSADITDLVWDAATLKVHQSKLVSITGATVFNKVVDSNGNITVTVKLGEKSIVLRWDSRVPVSGTNVLLTAEVGDLINIVNAPLGWNAGLPQLGYYVSSQAVVTVNPNLASFTVTFMDVESTLGTKNVFEGRHLLEFPNTDKDNLIFVGWFTDATLDTPWVSTPITENVTLYGKWEPAILLAHHKFDVGVYGGTGTGYAAQEGFEWNESFGVVKTNKDRVQINKSANEPHDNEAMLVFSVRDTHSSAWIEFDFSSYTNLSKISFEASVWNQSHFEAATTLPNGLFVLEVYVNGTWTRVGDNQLSSLVVNQYTELTFNVAGPGKFRIFYGGTSTISGNTTTALTVDNLKLFGKAEVIVNPVTLSYDPNFGEAEVVVKTISSGNLATPPILADRTGFNFLGWFEVEATEAFDFTTPITEDKTLEARWEEKVVTLQTIAEVLAGNDGDLVNFIGTITGFTPYTSNNNFDVVFMEDETGSIYIHRSSLPETIAIGDKYEVNGEIDIYNGLIQVAQAGQTYEFISSENTVSAPTVVTDLSTLVVTDQASRISLTGVVKSVNASGQSLVVTVGAKDITIRSMSSSAEAAINAHFLTATVGQTVNVTGAFVGWFNSPQLIPSLVSQFEFIEITAADKLAQAEAALTVLFDDKTFNMETAVTLPLVGLHGVQITWATNPVDAILDGKWMVVTEDILVTLTATLTLGEEPSKVVELEATVKFVDENQPPDPVEVTASYSGATGNMSANNNAEVIGLDPLLFTVTSYLGQQGNHIGLNAAGQIRLYGHRTSGDGSKLEISILSGTIIGVEFVFGASTNNPTANLVFGTDAPIGLVNDTLKNITMTYTGLDVTSFSLHNTQFVEAGGSNAQIYITSIKISYLP